MNPFMAQIMLFAGNFAPRGWALCEGQILPINQYQSLYSLLGTTYGGDGRTSFALPDLRGRIAVSKGQSNGGTNVSLGQKGGSETTTLVAANLPPTPVRIPASEEDANSEEPGGRTPAVTGGFTYHSTADAQMAPGSIVGAASHPINNLQPVIGMNYIIALQGTFPSRN